MPDTPPPPSPGFGYTPITLDPKPLSDELHRSILLRCPRVKLALAAGNSGGPPDSPSQEAPLPASLETANLISSKFIMAEPDPDGEEPDGIDGLHTVDGTGNHLPIFDFDFPIAIAPSSKKGHYHLYLNKRISWEKYVALLFAMEGAGLLDAYWVSQTVEKGEAHLRLPNIKKPQPKTIDFDKWRSFHYQDIFMSSGARTAMEAADAFRAALVGTGQAPRRTPPPPPAQGG